MTTYQADWVCSATSPPIYNGVVVVDNGRIVHVGPASEASEPKQYAGCAIIPGFVNAHTHLEISLLQGRLDGLPFPDWIVSLTRTKYERCSREVLKLSAKWGAMQMLRSGVTTVGEVMDVGTGWEAMLECGLQGVAFQEAFGPAQESAPEALRGLQEKVAGHRARETTTQRIGVSPHAPYTVSRRLYQDIRDYARHEALRMTAHVAESREETEFVRDGAGTFASFHKRRNIPVEAHGCLPVAYLDSLGLLGTDMVLIHVIDTAASELDRLRDTGTFVVHCPKSNAYLKHRIAPVAEMRARGIPVALGTDSLASNDGIDMFAEMRMAATQQRLGFDDVFRMATLEGARALGLEGHVGSLESGKRADFAVVTLRNPGSDPLEAMVRHARSSDVRATFVAGREVTFDDQEIQNIQERLAKSFEG